MSLLTLRGDDDIRELACGEVCISIDTFSSGYFSFFSSKALEASAPK
jgi:hypothetical protein